MINKKKSPVVEFCESSSYGSQIGFKALDKTLLYIKCKIASEDVIHTLANLFIEPGRPWKYGYVKSFISRLRDELLNREILNTLTEGEVLLERWRIHFNTKRLHSSLGCRPPAPEMIQLPTNCLYFS